MLAPEEVCETLDSGRFLVDSDDNSVMRTHEHFGALLRKRCPRLELLQRIEAELEHEEIHGVWMYAFRVKELES